jgi:hypothetical protein
MIVNELVANALSELNLPVYADYADAGSGEYIVFNYADERPVIYADDDDIADATEIQVHYYVRGKSCLPVKTAMRKLLKQAGFTIIATTQLYEDDTKYTHVIVECKIENEEGT